MNNPRYTCDRCTHNIPLFITHIRLDIEMFTDGAHTASTTKRYCDDCCADPSMAVLFKDVIDQPVKRMQISKVWG